jgi:putative membrane protein
MGQNRAIFISLSTGFPVFILHLLVTISIFLMLTLAYRWVTRQRFLEFVNNHNVAAAISFGSVQLSFAIQLAACLVGSVSVLDLFVWAVPIGLVQFICYLVFDAIFHNLPRRVEQNDVAVAIMVAATRLSIAIIFAGGILE